ncbi:MAG: efflux RND transporter periplasmic adaptor subunit, partial [Candidatus Krumholzibacteriota bacterium]|nr:efflux RND transporter periplasmic adaptor subunit [Candidatus Krumholzibacteriota bacterium]
MSNPAKRKKSRRGIIILVLAIVVVAAFAVRFQAIRGRVVPSGIREIQEKEGRPVEVITARTGDIEVWNTLAGTVEGIVQYPLVSTNSIPVMDILRREGDRVRAGDEVIRLEKVATNPMLHSYARAKALYQDALADRERMESLYQEGAISRQALDKTRMALEIARSDLQNAREGTDLIADREGVITSILVEEGEMANNGSPVAWVARTDSVRLVFEAGSRQALHLRKGQKAIWQNQGNGDGGEGFIYRLDLSADPHNHLLGGEALFANSQGKLIPGLLVSFRVLTEERRGVITIPGACLLESENGNSVYVVASGE